MNTTAKTGLACGYCGSALPPDPYEIHVTRKDPRGAHLRPDVVSVHLCGDCKVLTRYSARSVWEKVVGPEIAAPYTDEQLHKAGAEVIRPLFETQTTITAPTLPWAHVGRAQARIALAALDIDKFSRDPKYRSKSGLACASCGVLESAEWTPGLINSWPTCLDCQGFLSGDFGCGKRVRAIFGVELKHSTSTPHIPADVLRCFAELDRPPTTARFAYITEAEKDALRAYLVSIRYPLAPASWRDRFKAKVTTAPARKAEPVSAVGV